MARRRGGRPVDDRLPLPEADPMKLPRARFTIKRFMIATAIVAVFLGAEIAAFGGGAS